MKKRCISFIHKSLIAVFCTFTVFSHCLFGYASIDDEYFTITEFDYFPAYNYWLNYGLSADQSYNYNEISDTTGYISLTSTISLSGTNGVSFTGASNNDVLGMIHNFTTDETVYNLVVNSNENVGSINYYGSTNSLNLACTYSNPETIGGAADSEYSTLTCRDPNFNDAIPYYVTIYNQDGKVRLESYTPDQYAIFRKITDDSYDYENDSDLHLEGLYSFSGSLSVNESGSLSGTGNVNLRTITASTNNLKFVLPKLNGNISNPTGSLVNRMFRYNIYKDDPYIIAFFFSTNRDVGRNFTVYLNNSDPLIQYEGSSIFRLLYRSVYNSGLNFVAFETKSDLSNDLYNKTYFNTYDSVYNNLNMIPLYVGYKSKMSDKLYRFIYGSDRIIESLEKQTNIIENGNTNSQQKEQALNTQTTQMQNQMNTFQNIEDTAGNNMNNALNNINTNPSLLSTNKFLVSVDWIRQQYNRLVTNTPFEAVITFCLVFGLGLLLLGKVR